MLEIECLPAARCTVDHPLNQRDIVRMHAVEHHVDRGRGRRVVLEYSVALLGPEDFSAWDLPTKAASAAQPLRLCQIGPALPQGAFSSLLILDIEADSIPFDDISPVAAQRYAARHMPAVFAVDASNTQVHLECLSICQASAPFGSRLLRTHRDGPCSPRRCLLLPPERGRYSRATV